MKIVTADFAEWEWGDVVDQTLIKSVSLSAVQFVFDQMRKDTEMTLGIEGNFLPYSAQLDSTPIVAMSAWDDSPAPIFEVRKSLRDIVKDKIEDIQGSGFSADEERAAFEFWANEFRECIKLFKGVGP